MVPKSADVSFQIEEVTVKKKKKKKGKHPINRYLKNVKYSYLHSGLAGRFTGGGWNRHHRVGLGGSSCGGGNEQRCSGAIHLRWDAQRFASHRAKAHLSDGGKDRGSLAGGGVERQCARREDQAQVVVHVEDGGAHRYVFDTHCDEIEGEIRFGTVR